jgi:hypothetical protein
MKIVWLNCRNPKEVSPPPTFVISVWLKFQIQFGRKLANSKWTYFVSSSASFTLLCMDKPPVDVFSSGNDKLWISANCNDYGKSTLFQTHSILDVDNPGYESDFMSRVHLEYDYYEKIM